MNTRRATALGIVLLWLAALGWLIDREYFGPRRTPTLIEGALSISPSWMYFRVEAGGRQVGFASTSVDTLPSEIHVNEVLVTEQPVLGKLRHTEIRTSTVLSRLLQLQSFSSRLRTEDGLVTIFGYVYGDTLLGVKIVTGDSARWLYTPMPRTLVPTGLVPLRLVFGHELAPAKRYDMHVFDPLRLESRDLALTVVAESTFIVADSARHDSIAGRWLPARSDTVKAWRVNQRSGSATAQFWVDELGQVVQAVTPDGFTLRREAFELAFENFRKRDTTVEVATPSRIVARTPVAEHLSPPPRVARAFKARLAGLTLDGYQLNGDRQTLAGDTLTVRREGEREMEAQYRLPVNRHSSPELEPTLLIQSDSTLLRAAAREVTGRTPVPRRAAELLLRAVFERTAKAPSVDVPNALRVLRKARGDASELTVLYVALARSIGLPARPVAGLWYTGGKFYIHTWPEVYLNGWVAVDPTLGQFPADAAHLRFTIGALARPLEQAAIVGGLNITVLGVESDR